MDLPNPERTRRAIGLSLYLLGQLIGAGLLFVFFVALPVAYGEAQMLGFMCLGAVIALPAGALYLTVPRLLDRYDPEPWYALVGCLLWGGIAACGFSATINSYVRDVVAASTSPEAGEIVSTVLSAPIVEEFWKLCGVAGTFYFLRREFDGIVDGIIYATFTALGFATIENVIYYAQAAREGADALTFTFVVRGVVAPWGHPVYTAMTGIGFGVARETERAWVRWSAPLAGYAGAVMLHMIWNGAATIAGQLEGDGMAFFLCQLAVWFLFVGAFFVLVVVLVRRRGRILRQYLEDEVALRYLTKEEVDLVCSAFGLFRARLRWGRLGEEYVRACARLSLSKWHSVRAHNQNARTVSMDFIVPLRQRIRELRIQLGIARPEPHPGWGGQPRR